MRIIFMGTPEFAVPSLNALVAAGHDVVAVYSQPPRRAGRGKGFAPSPIQLRAEALGIDVVTPISLRDKAAQAAFAEFHADVTVVAAYGLILPRAILDAPRLGCINVHGSLLPRWRGAAPVQRAILAGDKVTGVTIMQMEAGLDTGAMLAVQETPIDAKTSGALMQEIAEIGADLLIKVIADPSAYPPICQPTNGAIYAPKIDKSESHLDFLVSAPQVERQIRAFSPRPGAYFEVNGERIRVLASQVASPAEFPVGGDVATVLDDRLSIACNPGVIRPTLIQRAGKSAMKPAELLRGLPIPPGTRLG